MNEASIKYLVVQSISSAILVFSIVSMKITEYSLFIAGGAILALIIKIAAFPFHQWFVRVLSKSNWSNSLILITWQKLAPIFLIIFQMKTIIIIIFIITSAFWGGVIQINKIKIIEILALSSIFNISWLTLRILLRTKLYLTFSLLYWRTVLLIMLTLKRDLTKKTASIKDVKIDKIRIVIIVANLAGIPPLTGFFAKWIVAMERVKIDILIWITLILIASAINFFVYLRIFASITLKKTQTTNYNPYPPKKGLLLLLFIRNLTPVYILVV